MIYKYNKYLSFRLTIVDYEFQNSTDDWDSNWLQTSVELKDTATGLLFSNTDPCLLTMELESLRGWFQSIILQRVSKNQLTFMERDLSFEYTENQAYLLLNFNLNPNGSQSAAIYRLEIENRDIEKIIVALDSLIVQFPVRNNPG